MPGKLLAIIGGILAVFGAFSSSCLAGDAVVASWYGGKYIGKRTASGDIFNGRALTAAHPDLAFGTMVEVRRLDNGRAVVVRINDRCRRCDIDLSRAAADHLALRRDGRALVAVRALPRIAQAD